MNVIVAVIAATLDPIKVLVIVGCFLVYYSRYTIPVAIIVATLIAEGILTKTQLTRNFGEGIVIQFISAIILTAIVYFAWFKIKNAINKKNTAE